MSKDMALCLAELRFRKDFAVIYRGKGGTNELVRRTPALSCWDALEWFKIVSGQDPQGRYELAVACRSTMAHAVLGASGAGVVN